MGIDNKTRKMLWGRSGNRCVFCRAALIIEPTAKSDASIVGEECHIHSSKTNGPRHEVTYPVELLDSYENLILLCSVHHKMIDDQYDTYTAKILKDMKINHEKWVAEKLSKDNEIEPIKVKRIKENIPSHLMRVQDGKHLFHLMQDCCAIEYDYDNKIVKENIPLISMFLQNVQDYIDIYSELDISSIFNAQSELDKNLTELSNSGIWVFADRENRIITGGKGNPDNFPVIILHILNNDDEQIIRVKLDD